MNYGSHFVYATLKIFRSRYRKRSHDCCTVVCCILANETVQLDLRFNYDNMCSSYFIKINLLIKFCKKYTQVKFRNSPTTCGW